MMAHFHIRGLSLSAHSRQWLEESLERLETMIPISVAIVVLEHRQGESPPFRVFVSFAVPGPDIHAEGRDHTMSAAWLKVVAALREQIQQRKVRQVWRSRDIPPLRCPKPRRSRHQAPRRVAFAASGK